MTRKQEVHAGVDGGVGEKNKRGFSEIESSEPLEGDLSRSEC